jgi:predicted RNA binding protein YcfA (HicA-like mRNA interferase family)
MPPWGPIVRRDLIRALRRAGFEGPFSGGRHEFMMKGDLVLTIPNPHGRAIGVGLLAMVLRQAGIVRQDWERL